ncbi:hypothetical protein DYB37_004000 [Aphanomyces astaci]|uniref:Uncharacterized protein n=1 Tax=Aphanomyces astaci TaxID=112090 RepID=A0A418DP82_APHAT|nr:hypothetical protein DYB35_006648 [Aphanomyces astaci]RHZ31760.1 hypothetical protein DYB37_004000 [Aphanomyces astaci]
MALIPCPHSFITSTCSLTRLSAWEMNGGGENRKRSRYSSTGSVVIARFILKISNRISNIAKLHYPDISDKYMSCTVLEEAFGRRMLDGTAEWSDVPEVIRSSFYVLHKSWRGYDKRLSRCEKSLAACLDRQARIELELVQQSRRDALCMPSARGTSSENELTELQQKMSALKDELAYKLDKVGFLTTMDGAMRVTHDEHTKHITEKLQAHSSRVETTLLKMKTVLSRKLVAVEGVASYP